MEKWLYNSINSEIALQGENMISPYRPYLFYLDSAFILAFFGLQTHASLVGLKSFLIYVP